MTIGFTMVGVGVGTQFHIGYVFQAQYIAVGESLQHDVLILFQCLQTTCIFECVLIHVFDTLAVGAIDGLLTQLSGRSLQVLFGQSIGNVAWHKLVLGHHVRLEPDTQ